MAFEVQAKILRLLPEQKGVSSKGEWVKNGFIVETQSDYPRKMQFDVLGTERWSKMSPYVQVGRIVKVSFDIESREWNNRWFTSLTAFSVFSKESEMGQSGTQSVQQSAAPQPQPQPAPQPQPQKESESDPLPF